MQIKKNMIISFGTTHISIKFPGYQYKPATDPCIENAPKNITEGIIDQQKL